MKRIESSLWRVRAGRYIGAMPGVRHVRAKAYTSSANLGHGFDVFAVAVDVGFDVVEIRRGERGGPQVSIELSGEASCDIPREPQRNTAGRAILAMMKDHRLHGPIRVMVRKGIPPGSGLGSSAASAAAAAAAADRYFGVGLGRNDLVHYAAQGEGAAAGACHADNVAAAVCGGFTIVAEGERPRVTQIPVPRSLKFVVVLPNVQVSTKAARAALPKQISLKEYAAGVSHSTLIALAVMRGDALALGEAIEGSFVDRSRSKLIPAFDAVTRAARRAGAAGVAVSGAGPALLAVAGKRGSPLKIAREMEGAFAKAGIASKACVALVAPGVNVREVVR